ncbi:DivIVA domain-containing protein [Aestuariimicrobium kwangyangense]|uniref:DivIVA domain-containing protein n=1 Tax=Aestuariimicrobium kwangyangense TaxID=396389 RepID=UPI0003B4C461|nr:DivIVA domain-containing protein [Aestuariimicrobium kwangyangense]
MTMTLDEVNQIRFPMARRPNEGYRAQEVDEFVDRVVATFQSMHEEADRAKAQVEALKADQAGVAHEPSGQVDQALVEENDRLKAEVAELRARAERAEAALAATQGSDTHDPGNAELEVLRQRNAELEQRTSDLDRQLAEARESAESRQPAEAAAEGQVQHGTGKLERLVVTTSTDASPAVIRLVQLATEQAEGVVADAQRDAEGMRNEAAADAKQTRDEADAYAAETTKAADAKAEQITAEATSNADSLVAAARANAEQVEVDAKNRRTELFQTLESERDEFAGKVDQLKAWESDYRSSLTQHLRSQAEALESGQFQPGGNAALLGDERSASATPRLDALLAQKQ